MARHAGRSGALFLKIALADEVQADGYYSWFGGKSHSKTGEK